MNNEEKKGVTMPPVELLRHSNWMIELTSEGHSMAPLIKAGDVLSVTCGDAKALRPGDIICFRRGVDHVAHRLIACSDSNPDLIYEKGDAEAAGRWINRDAIIGVVERINGKMIDSAYRENVRGMNTMERHMARLKNKVWNFPLPRWVLNMWRGIKVSHLRRRLADHESSGA